jgi:hypothetical protein
MNSPMICRKRYFLSRGFIFGLASLRRKKERREGRDVEKIRTRHHIKDVKDIAKNIHSRSELIGNGMGYIYPFKTQLRRKKKKEFKRQKQETHWSKKAQRQMGKNFSWHELWSLGARAARADIFHDFFLAQMVPELNSFVLHFLFPNTHGVPHTNFT